MILLIDIGNSNIVFGLCENDKIVRTFRLKAFLDKTSDEFYVLFKSFCDFNFEGVMISSVVPVITSALIKMFKSHYNVEPLILGPGIKTGVLIKSDDPKQVGADLICDVAGAKKYADETIVVDLGTATKYIYSKNNAFLGVSIAPGVSISMQALISKAALLSQVELQTPTDVLGKNTITAVQSGVIYGAASQVDGMINRIFKEIGHEVKILMTGGLSNLIAPLVEHEITLIPDLNLEGLLEIYKKNIK